MDGLREPSMARDFFRGTRRDQSPAHRWIRRSIDKKSTDRNSRDYSAESAIVNPSQAWAPEVQDYELQRPPQMAPLVLLGSRGKRVALEPVMVHSSPIVGRDSRPLQYTPSKPRHAKVEGDTSPTGPLDLPDSPVSSEESPRAADFKLARVRSMRSVSPSVQRRSLSITPPEDTYERRSQAPARTMPVPAKARFVEPVKQQQTAPAFLASSRSVSVDRVPPNRFIVAQHFVSQKEAAEKKAPEENVAGGKVFTRKPKETVRQPTPFRRGLNAIKGRLFSDSRKDSAQKAEVQVVPEIARTQQELVARHKVKPVEKQGLKGHLVNRLSRAFHRSAHQESPTLALPAPMSAQPQVGPSMQSLLTRPQSSVPSREPFAESTSVTAVPESVSSISVLEWNALAQQPASSRAQQPRLACALERKAGWMNREDKSSEEDSEAEVHYRQRIASESDSESDSEDDFKRAPRPSAGPVFRYPSWPPQGQRSMTVAQSWDMQSATARTVAMHSQRTEQLRSSEAWSKSGWESLGPTASPRTAVDFPMRGVNKQTQREEGQKLVQAIPPAPVPALPSPQPASYRLLRSRTEILPSQVQQARYNVDPYSSDEDVREEDRLSRKQEMAAALQQLRAFQAGGAKQQARLQTPPSPDLRNSQIVRTSPSPLKTMLRSAGVEGTANGMKRLGSSLLGGRSREPSPLRHASGLLASPRRLRPEMSPQRVPPPPGRTSLDQSSTGKWPTLERPSSAAAQGRLPGRATQTPYRSRPVAAAAAFFRSFTPGRQRPQVV